MEKNFEKMEENFYNDEINPEFSGDIGYMLKIVNDALEKKANETLRNEDLTLSQLKVLGFINTKEEGKTTQKELEDALAVSHPTINGILKRLEAKGIIVSELSVNRRMTKIVELTEAGKEIVRKTEGHRLEHEKRLSKNLSAEEKASLLFYLKKVYEGLKE